MGGEEKLPRGGNRDGRRVLPDNDAAAVTPECSYRGNLSTLIIGHVNVDLTEKLTTHPTKILALEKLLPNKVVNVERDEALPCIEFHRNFAPS